MNLHKISYGIDHNLSIDNQKWILNKYKNYIKNIYMGIPDKQLQNNLTQRSKEFLAAYDQNKIDIIIDYARALGLQLNFTINNPSPILEPKVYSLIEKYQPEEICTLDLFIEQLKTNCSPRIKFVRSFYNKSIYDTSLYKYDISIYKNHIILHPQQINIDTELRIILNFACPWKCQLCGDFSQLYPYRYSSNRLYTQHHTELIQQEIQTGFEGSLEKYLAYHLWSGKDIIKFENQITNSNYSYKFANRTMDFSLTEVDMCLETYTSNKDFDIPYSRPVVIGHLPIAMKTVNKTFRNSYQNFNQELFVKYKDDYWELAAQTINKLNTIMSARGTSPRTVQQPT